MGCNADLSFVVEETIKRSALRDDLAMRRRRATIVSSVSSDDEAKLDIFEVFRDRARNDENVSSPFICRSAGNRSAFVVNRPAF